MADNDLSPQDRDLLTRTVLSEGQQDGAPGMVAVASVIKNRVTSGGYGDTPHDVVLAPNQFTAWSLPRNDPNNPSRWSTKNPDYQKAAAIVDSVWSGQTPDPTGGADHYLNPDIVKARTGTVPQWAQGASTAQIGGHSFYAPNGPVKPDILGTWNKPSSAPASASTAAPADQPDLLGSWGAQLTTAAPDRAPLQITIHPQGYTVPPGDETPAQYTNRVLAEHQGDSLGDYAARFGAGALRGVGDIADTLAKGIAATGTGGANVLQGAGVISSQTAQTVQNWGAGVNQGVTTDRDRFDVLAANSPLAQAGRVGGQIVGTAPMLGAGGAAIEGATGLDAALAGRPIIGAMVRGAGAGAGASALTSAASNEPLADQVLTGAGAGAALGPIGYGASHIGAALRTGVFGAVTPETAQLAQTARNTYGIPVTAGQISSSPPVRFLDSVLQRLPLTGYGARTAKQQTAFNRSVAGALGENSDVVTTQTIRDAKDRVGDVFDSVAQRTPVIHADSPFYQRMSDILTDARSVLPASELAPLENQMRDITSVINPNTRVSPGGYLTGETYQAVTRKGAPLDRAIQSKDPNIRFYAGQIREALDDAMQRSAPADAVQDLVQARGQWKAIKTVEPLAKKSTTGDISPPLLLGAVNKSYAGNGGALGELGRIGQRFIKEPPSSGTPERLLAMKLGGAALGAAGLGGAYQLDPENFQRNAVLGGLALGGARGASALLRSNMLTNALIRSGLPRAGGAYPLANLLSRAAPAAALTYRNANGLPGQ